MKTGGLEIQKKKMVKPNKKSRHHRTKAKIHPTNFSAKPKPMHFG